MKAIIKAASVLVAFLFLIQCKKTENEPSERYSYLLGRWRLTEYAKDSNNNGKADSSERFAASTNPVHENEFLPDGKGKSYLITSSNIQVFDFTWSLENAETVMRLIADPGTSNERRQELPVKALDSKELILYSAESADTFYIISRKL